jgi:hypothetical protein
MLGKNSSRTPGISGERPLNVHKSDAEARVRCMPLLDAAVSYKHAICTLSPDHDDGKG